MVLARRKDVSRLSQYLTLQLLSGDQVSAHAYTAQAPCLLCTIRTSLCTYIYSGAGLMQCYMQLLCACVHVCIYGKHHEVLFPSEQANEVQAKGYFRVLGRRVAIHGLLLILTVYNL